MKKIILIMSLLSSFSICHSQININSSNISDIDIENITDDVINTGAAVSVFNPYDKSAQDAYFMVYDHTSNISSELCYINHKTVTIEDATNPDVVVYNQTVQVVFEYHGSIYYNTYAHSSSSPYLTTLVNRTLVAQGQCPNIDQYDGNTVITFENNKNIYACIGDINGNYQPIVLVESSQSNFDLSKPDVSIHYTGNQYIANIVYIKESLNTNPVNQGIVVESSNIGNPDFNNPIEFNEITYYSDININRAFNPRIASPNLDNNQIANTLNYAVVYHKHSENPRLAHHPQDFIQLYRRILGRTNYSNTVTLNNSPYHVNGGPTYPPLSYLKAKSPVISFSNNDLINGIYTVWGNNLHHYMNQSYQVVGRHLNYMGEKLNPYTQNISEYSIINLTNNSEYETINNIVPCIAARFSIDIMDNKFIGWDIPSYIKGKVNNFSSNQFTTPDILKPIITLNPYPNPFCNNITIHIEKTTDIKIYNLLGQCIYSVKVEPGIHDLDLNHLKSGLFLLNTNQNSFKILKE